uniref:Hexosyltransferase n=1 Tax=Daphnia galeata TaxID=27404 RepID=A0A8J2WQB5_9CRUS|nr:unnamed protein product [Daphnia galeata]
MLIFLLKTILPRNMKVIFKWLLLIGTVCYFIYLVDLIQRQPSAFFIFDQHQSQQQQKYGQNDITQTVVTIDRELFDYLVVHLHDTEYDGVDNYIRFMTVFKGLKPLPGIESLVPGMGPVVNDMSQFQHYPINLVPCPSSSSNSSNQSRSLFIGVISGPGNFERRATIRRTWHVHLNKNQQNKKSNKNALLDLLRFAFVIGQTNDSVVQQQVKDESEKYGDILQINMMDKYVDLSVKLTGLFHWLDTFCSRVDYVLKVDDDVYVNVHNLATVLHSLNVSEPSVYGRQCGGNIPDRSASKWKTGFEHWPWQRFPIYFQGAGVIIAGSAVRPILSAMQVTPYFIWEDMYLIGLCAVKAKIQLRTSDRIFVDMPDNPVDPCFIGDNVMWTTDSADVMNASHFASHNQFYDNKLQPSANVQQCNSSTQPAVEFPFGYAQQN